MQSSFDLTKVAICAPDPGVFNSIVQSLGLPERATAGEPGERVISGPAGMVQIAARAAYAPEIIPANH